MYDYNFYVFFLFVVWSHEKRGGYSILWLCAV